MILTVDEISLADVCEQIGALLAKHDLSSKVAWLATRAEALRSGDPEREAGARAELRMIINGMGSLNDLSLPDDEDRDLLRNLTETLWILS